MAGYSGTPLLKKLGLKEGLKLRLINPPDDYFQWLNADVSSQLCASKEIPDWVHLFAPSRKDFEREMKSLKIAWNKNPAIVIWVSWYKKSSGIVTDLTEDLIREYALKNGLVDIKVCAVSEQWSGLKLVVPLKRR
ncbi:hypothetical protein Q4E93_33075 [Flavitalea sp. BT771]|uniref:hypothetical protein n=1 Tax=Flavitalea sp. BT771 TaxID=3063329 RepID=UPI0026E3B3CE|nr:hypothetical protein [Flavitalea sp. BT771]MDO6435494.1 hypothetical protein [Flavitalea sp. BT771]MDV6224394.1 hypothetical protein [Flavitalea sp. BT771]